MQFLVFSFIDKKHKSTYSSLHNLGFSAHFNNIKRLNLKQFNIGYDKRFRINTQP
jgi:hypothetical protein